MNTTAPNKLMTIKEFKSFVRLGSLVQQAKVYKSGPAAEFGEITLPDGGTVVKIMTTGFRLYSKVNPISWPSTSKRPRRWYITEQGEGWVKLRLDFVDEAYYLVMTVTNRDTHPI